MGRKPNSLILEFFERGPKLEDNSNRYQHTCKSCGENFPKGRIDSLTAHLLKKCPAVAPIDRQRALKQLSETPNQHGSYNQLAISIRQEEAASAAAAGQPIDDALEPHTDLSPLETLAEVSRQRLDNGQYVPEPRGSKKRKRGAEVSGPTQPEFQLPDDLFFKPDANLASIAADSNELSMQQEEWFKTLRNSSPVDVVDEDEQTRVMLRQGIDQFNEEQRLQNNGHFEAPTAQMIPHQLALAASAAAEMLPETDDSSVRDETKTWRGRGGGRHPPSFTVTLNSTNSNSSNAVAGSVDPTIDPQLQEDHSQSLSTSKQDPAESATPSQQQPIVASPDVPDPHSYLNNFSVSGDIPRVKSRGRFSDTRRKEVQEVRKQGACVRCRMLKKPCSGGTPCSTCKNVESARLWKAPCIRARIADEFDLYGTDLHKVISFQEISQIRELVKFEKSPRKIEATHFRDTDVEPASFACVRGSASDHLLYQAVLPYQSGQKLNLDIELLDTDSEDIPTKLFSYIKRTERLFFDQEPSTFMRPTLLMAHDLVAEKLDPLLSRALELWCATHVLVDPNVAWDILSVDDTSESVPSEDSDRRQPSPTSVQLLTNQLRSFTEKHAAQLAKSVMNDLERRLLQRQQSAGQHFETFLSAIILLNCVERMCWYFSTWVYRLQNAGNDPEMSKAMWPLPKDPEDFVHKGEKIAGVVTMLLRMRGVPPAMDVGEGGVLYPSFRMEKKLGKLDAHEDNREEQFQLAAAWLDNVGTSTGVLEEARMAERWDEKDCRCWDLRYISLLLLPPEPVAAPTPPQDGYEPMRRRESVLVDVSD